MLLILLKHLIYSIVESVESVEAIFIPNEYLSHSTRHKKKGCIRFTASTPLTMIFIYSIKKKTVFSPDHFLR